MSRLRAYCLGWDLVHPDIRPLEVDDAAAWLDADVLFFSPLAVEQLWRHAVGERTRMFRSAQRETECWQGLLTLNQRLQGLLERGGHLIGRLDLPRSRCEVRKRPSDARFPAGSSLNAYEALATVNQAFAVLAGTCGRLPAQDIEVRRIGHPLDAYLAAFARQALPVVGLPDVPEGWESMAATSGSHCVAFAVGPAAWLPPLAAPQPEREAACLIAAAAALLGVARCSPDRATPRPRDATPLLEEIERRERFIAARMIELSAQREALVAQREARTWLWDHFDGRVVSSSGSDFVRQARVALGLDESFAGRLDALEVRRALAAAFMHPQGPAMLERLSRILSSTDGSWCFRPHEVLLEAAERQVLAG